MGAAGRELVLLVNTENMAKASAAQWIADQLESAGMKARVDNLPFEEYISALEADGSTCTWGRWRSAPILTCPRCLPRMAR